MGPRVFLVLFFLFPTLVLAEERVPPYLGGRFPSRAPRESDVYELKPAFPDLAFKDMTGLIAQPRSNRLVVTLRQGQAWWFENEPGVQDKHLLLDLTKECQGWDDSGLLGMAFHPEFGQEGSPNREYVYVWYNHTAKPIKTPRGRPFGPPKDMTNRLARFTVKDGACDPASELVLIDQHDRHLWHNGGGMFFDTDGFLYVSNGDEGADFGNENHVDRNLFSGVLRIDVDEKPERSHPIPKQPLDGKTAHYSIPNDNPWVGTPGALEEFWAIGFRNPHRMTYDAPTKTIWVGDVGDGAYEEVDRVEKGGNYQWRWREGKHDHGARPAKVVGREMPPVYDYDRSEGYCVIGGYVYRGGALPELVGKYVFGDLNGAVWSLGGANATRLATLPQAPNSSYGVGLSSFGVDARGELYLCQLGDEGHLFQLARRERPPVKLPRLLSQTGAFADVGTLAVAPGMVAYDVASPLWSDGATKTRWVSAPGAATFSEDEAWQFPKGTVFVKHFERGGRRLETRFLVVGDEVYGLTYRWNAAQTDAELLDGQTAETGDDWTFPSRADCLRCHNPQAGWVLGGRTRQLAKGDQLERWRAAGLVTIPAGAKVDALADPRDPGAPLEARVRSYVDANCMHCHLPSGSGRGWFDARATTPLAGARILDGPVVDALGNDGARVVKPGEPQLSLLLERMRRADERRMPPLAVSHVDEAGTRLIDEWIRGLPRTSARLGMGLSGQYFSGVELEQPVFERVDPVIDFDWTGRSPAPGLGATDFSVRWRGFVEIPATGEWTFFIATDDGGRLWIDGQLVIDRWVDQGETESAAKVKLVAGRRVPIVYEYYQRGGAASARLRWAGPGQPKGIVPPYRLSERLPRRWL